LAQQLGLRVRTIVLDPGHGGKDPGAIAFGLKEKDIVLKVAKMLAPILEKRLRCKVILTRTTDVFIPLEERTAIANTHDADLFVSLHINASPSEKAHGIETYYLNLTTNPEAMRVAARENATSTHQMSDLQNILSDIMKNSKINESARLAELVNNSIITGLKKNFSDIKSMGVKQAPFYVLIGAEMPAILVEMSFITNKDDVKHLQNNHFLENIASDISSGIQSYISSNTAGL
jgi:N-acetylmuramoyl-L-alanine amidase